MQMDQYGAATGERNAQVPAQDRPCANTSKAAVLGFTRTLADKWGLHAITVYAICPGFFPTAMAGPAITMAGDWKGPTIAPRSAGWATRKTSKESRCCAPGTRAHTSPVNRWPSTAASVSLAA